MTQQMGQNMMRKHRPVHMAERKAITVRIRRPYGYAIRYVKPGNKSQQSVRAAAQ